VPDHGGASKRSDERRSRRSNTLLPSARQSAATHTPVITASRAPSGGQPAALLDSRVWRLCQNCASAAGQRASRLPKQSTFASNPAVQQRCLHVTVTSLGQCVFSFLASRSSCTCISLRALICCLLDLIRLLCHSAHLKVLIASTVSDSVITSQTVHRLAMPLTTARLHHPHSLGVQTQRLADHLARAQITATSFCISQTCDV